MNIQEIFGNYILIATRRGKISSTPFFFISIRPSPIAAFRIPHPAIKNNQYLKHQYTKTMSEITLKLTKNQKDVTKGRVLSVKAKNLTTPDIFYLAKVLKGMAINYLEL